MPAETVTWIDGAVIERAALPFADRAVWLGDALRETVLVVGGRPVLLEAHMDRLLDSAAALQFDLPQGIVTRLDEALDAVLRVAGHGSVALDIVVTRGADASHLDLPAGQRPTVILQATPTNPSATPPRRAVLLDTPRIDPLDPVSGHRTTSALRWVEARRRARAAGADLALLPTIAGDVAQADEANLFLRPDAGADAGSIVTPPLSRGIRPGVVRAWAIDALRAHGDLVVERPVEPAELRSAAEAFLSDSLLGIHALRTIDGVLLPTRAPIAARLAAAYAKLAGLPKR